MFFDLIWIRKWRKHMGLDMYLTANDSIFEH